MEYVVLVTSKEFGTGDPILGEKLMYSYFYSLSEGDTLPSNILFLNNGVKLTTEETPLIAVLQSLVDQGVTLYVCGLCLDYYNLNAELKVGEVGNMYLNQDIMAQAPKVITIG